MIRDRIVEGVSYENVAEKMQMNSELTLERAITMERQNESIKSNGVSYEAKTPMD